MSSAKHNTFTTSFPIWIPFISFSSLIAMARTSRILLNKSSENEHPCLVLDLRGNALSFSPLNMMLTLEFSFVVFIMLRFVPSMPSSWKVFFFFLS